MMTTTPNRPIDMEQQLGRLGVVPVVVIDNEADAVPLGRALVAGGLPCAEITLRTPAATAAIRHMAAACPEILLGAGTVLTVAQAEEAVAAGAQFVVTPGFDTAVVTYCLSQNIPIIPGVMTPTEINMALSHGLRLLKFFPAEAAGGVRTLKAISAPYADVKFMPTGGITPANLGDYLALTAVVACGGSWLASHTLLAAGAYEEISALAGQAVALGASRVL
ncbi:MAG: bifunctional 4-hydroxy-2-oxoglutarate aldolase/2-dehydro-3-deoxy-phosphogluconate aldolase [Anaerolineales bacterium]|nr:bifunctional 4-hydroxy-2-oxoglutarate aldolase/2-dehydro-3-deoxy-phosphogluconate aldolase [Anaerolineales bacterium]